KVKAGGAITATDEVLFAFKGNKTSEFWRYMPSPPLYASRFSPLASHLSPLRCSVSVFPNPLRSGSVTLSLSGQLSQQPAGPVDVSIIDVAGRVVRHSSFVMRTSSLPLDLRGLSAGVYTVRLAADGCQASRRIVIPR
ncbi:MAG: T9SS type A sorting domain-containing protein, partial [candidate division WOR-3 bacterium]